jgi:non-heme chloroperoxidase
MPTPHPSFRLHQMLLPSGVHLEYAEQGPPGGTPVLMLHGITDSWRSFDPVLPYLPEDWHVISLSQRGHGHSSKPASGYRARDFAADVAEFLCARKLPPVLLVGHSMGAANAMRLVLDHPQRVRALVAAGAFARFDDKPELAAFIREQILPLTDPVPRELARAFQLDTIAGPVAHGLVDAMVDESLRVPARVWRDAFAALADDRFGDQLRHITVPTLVAWGDADRFVPATDTHRLLREIPDARLARFEGVGHALHWEQPQRFARVLMQFVASLEERPVALA